MSGKEDPCYKLKLEEIQLLKKQAEVLKKRTTILLKTGNKDEVADTYVQYMTLLHRINAEEDTLPLRSALNDKDIDTEANELSMKMTSNSMTAMFDNKMTSILSKDKMNNDPKSAITEIMTEFTGMLSTVTETSLPRKIEKKDKPKVNVIYSDEEEEVEEKPKKVVVKKVDKKEVDKKTQKKR